MDACVGAGIGIGIGVRVRVAVAISVAVGVGVGIGVGGGCDRANIHKRLFITSTGPLSGFTSGSGSGMESITNERDGGREVNEDILHFRVLYSDASMNRDFHGRCISIVVAIRVVFVAGAGTSSRSLCLWVVWTHGQDMSDTEGGVVAEGQSS